MKIRWPVLIGQIIFVALGLLLIAAGLSIQQSIWYHGPPPGLWIIPGIILVAVAIILSTLHKRG